eukprot:2536213-Pleurochrysis_carterae.AAC.7
MQKMQKCSLYASHVVKKSASSKKTCNPDAHACVHVAKGRRLSLSAKIDANLKAGCEPHGCAFDLRCFAPANFDLAVLDVVLRHCQVQGKLALTLLEAHYKKKITE